HQGGAGQPPGAHGPAGLAQRDHLGVADGGGLSLKHIVAAAEHLPVPVHHHGADRHVAACRGEARLVQGGAHPACVALVQPGGQRGPPGTRGRARTRAGPGRRGGGQRTASSSSAAPSTPAISASASAGTSRPPHRPIRSLALKPKSASRLASPAGPLGVLGPVYSSSSTATSSRSSTASSSTSSSSSSASAACATG